MTVADSPRDIPEAAYYVAMTDKFMSGWGHAAGKTNRHVIPCDTYDEAQAITENAMGRSEMVRVTISTNRPRAKDGVLLTYGDKAAWLRRWCSCCGEYHSVLTDEARGHTLGEPRREAFDGVQG